MNNNVDRLFRNIKINDETPESDITICLRFDIND